MTGIIQQQLIGRGDKTIYAMYNYFCTTVSLSLPSLAERGTRKETNGSSGDGKQTPAHFCQRSRTAKPSCTKLSHACVRANAVSTRRRRGGCLAPNRSMCPPHIIRLPPPAVPSATARPPLGIEGLGQLVFSVLELPFQGLARALTLCTKPPRRVPPIQQNVVSVLIVSTAIRE